MRTMAIAVLVGLLTATAAAAQEGSEGAVDFVRSVYADYATDGPWPTEDTRLDAVFTPRMAALIRRDRELAVSELPYLDADPICDCQDAEGLDVLDARVSRDGQGAILVTTRFVNGGFENRSIIRLAGNPIRGWRIDDILSDSAQPSLAQALTDSNRRIERGARASGRD